MKGTVAPTAWLEVCGTSTTRLGEIYPRLSIMLPRATGTASQNIKRVEQIWSEYRSTTGYECVMLEMTAAVAPATLPPRRVLNKLTESLEACCLFDIKANLPF